jgi:hydroxyacylglutathione hydrolase
MISQHSVDSGLKVHIFCNGIFKQHCYLVEHNSSGDVIIIDPGSQGEQIKSFLSGNNLIPRLILLTHGHFDHIGAVDYLSGQFGIDCIAHENDRKLIRQASIYAFRIAKQNLQPPKSIKYIDDFDVYSWSGGVVSAFKAPGHTAGSLCYLFNRDALFTGDVLFNKFIGPTLYSESNLDLLKLSIDELFINCNANNSCIIFPGHGPSWRFDEAQSWWSLNRVLPPQFSIFKKN